MRHCFCCFCRYWCCSLPLPLYRPARTRRCCRIPTLVRAIRVVPSPPRVLFRVRCPPGHAPVPLRSSPTVPPTTSLSSACRSCWSRHSWCAVAIRIQSSASDNIRLQNLIVRSSEPPSFAISLILRVQHRAERRNLSYSFSWCSPARPTGVSSEGHHKLEKVCPTAPLRPHLLLAALRHLPLAPHRHLIPWGRPLHRRQSPPRHRCRRPRGMARAGHRGRARLGRGHPRRHPPTPGGAHGRRCAGVSALGRGAGVARMEARPRPGLRPVRPKASGKLNPRAPGLSQSQSPG